MSKKISELLHRYEEARLSHKNIYFDADEFDLLADYFDTNGELEIAVEVVKSGLEIHPQSTALLIKKARFVMYNGNYTQAIQLLSNITGYEYELHMLRIECFLNLEMWAEAHLLTQEVLDEENSDLETVYTDLGLAYLEAEQYKEAILYLETGLKYEAENLEALSELAYAYEMINDFDNAIVISNRLLDIDAYNYETWLNLGKLHSIKKEYEKAVDDFDFALTINSGDINILKLKGHCLSLLGRTEEAIEIFDSILLDNPDDSTIYFLLSECYQAIDMFEKALAMIEKYNQEYENSGVEYIAKKVQLLIQMDKTAEAELMVQERMKLEPKSVELHIILAEILIEQELVKEAEATLLAVYEGNEDDFYLVNMLSILSIRKEDFEKAIEYTEQLYDMDVDNLDTRERLALLYLEANDNEQFNNLLAEFTDTELMELFKYVYTPQHEELFDREQLILYLNRAREQRTLFKNLKY